MRTELYLAKKFFLSRRKKLFSFITTFIAIAGVTIGTAALVVTIGVMSGFREELQKKLLAFQPHITLIPIYQNENIDYYLKQLKSSYFASDPYPFSYGQIILKSSTRAIGSILRGVDITKEEEFRKLLKTSSLNKGGIIIGRELAYNLQVSKDDEIVAISPQEIKTYLGLFPKMEKFKVTEIFQTGLFDLDANLAIINIEDAKKLLGKASINGIGIKIKNPLKIDEVIKNFDSVIKNRFLIRSWKSMHKNLFAAIKLEKITMFLILCLIVLVASLNIASNQILFSIQRAKEIGILKALGMEKSSLREIFFYEGVYIGLSGSVLGVMLGLAISFFLKKFQFIKLPPDVYYISYLPVKISEVDILIIFFAALSITIISSIYPSIKASQIQPAEVLRYG